MNLTVTDLTKTFTRADERIELFRDFNLTLNAGEALTVLGPSGSGKTTLLRMIAGLERPDGGKILFDGTDSEELDNKSLRHILGYVGQDGTLLGRSIMSNLVMLAEDYTQEEVEEVCKLTHIYDDIMSLPMKAETIVMEKGSVFSGGTGDYTQAALPAVPVDTTGAGDTFAGFFLAGALQGFDTQKALYFASAAAAIAITRSGASASIPDRDEVFERINRDR